MAYSSQDANADRPTLRWGGLTLYKPRLVPILVTVLLVGMCLGLGIWQVQRLAWKTELITQMEAAHDGQPLIKARLPENLDALVEKNFARVNLPGKFIHAHEFHRIGQYHNGQTGYDILTPFQIEGDGRIILVNRGWVPLDKKNPKNRPEDPRTDETFFLNGILLAPSPGSYFLPDHDVKDNIWFWYDIARMNQESGLHLPPVVVEMVNPDYAKGSLPIPRSDFTIALRNDHLGYAIIWFSLTVAGLVIFFLYHLKSREKA